MRLRSVPAVAVILLQFVTSVQGLHASEYLGNNQRTGYTDTGIPAKPVLLWTYKERHAPKTAWPEPFGELQFIDFDYSDQVTIGGQLVYFGSSADHAVRALDAGSGEEQWVFYTEGPVRFAPVLYKDRLYAVSDDGHLYCLKASDGSLDKEKFHIFIFMGQSNMAGGCKESHLYDDPKETSEARTAVD